MLRFNLLQNIIVSIEMGAYSCQVMMSQTSFSIWTQMVLAEEHTK